MRSVTAFMLYLRYNEFQANVNLIMTVSIQWFVIDMQAPQRYGKYYRAVRILFCRGENFRRKERNKINPKSQNSAETVLYCYLSRIIGGDYANHSSETIMKKRVRMYM